MIASYIQFYKHSVPKEIHTKRTEHKQRKVLETTTLSQKMYTVSPGYNNMRRVICGFFVQKEFSREVK